MTSGTYPDMTRALLYHVVDFGAIRVVLIGSTQVEYTRQPDRLDTQTVV